MQESLQRFPGVHAPPPPGRESGGSDQGAADAVRKLQRPPDGHVWHRRQVRSVSHHDVCVFRRVRVSLCKCELALH